MSSPGPDHVLLFPLGRIKTSIMAVSKPPSGDDSKYQVMAFSTWATAISYPFGWSHLETWRCHACDMAMSDTSPRPRQDDVIPLGVSPHVGFPKHCFLVVVCWQNHSSGAFASDFNVAPMTQKLPSPTHQMLSDPESHDT